jgi:hypothetical protein
MPADEREKGKKKERSSSVCFFTKINREKAILKA